MPSPHLSTLELWKIIADNDLGGLERAMFILGVKIHCTPLWLNHPAIVFAIRLGHLEQAKLLLDDLSLYPTHLWKKFFPHDDDIIHLAKEVIKHHESDPWFYTDLICKFISNPADNDNEWLRLIIMEILKAEAFVLLENLAASNEWCVLSIVKYCFECEKFNILRIPETFSQHPAFITEVENQNKLRLAIMISDCDSVQKLVEEENTELYEIDCSETIFKLPGFLEHLIQLDCVDMFRTLFGQDSLKYTLELTGIKLQKLLHLVLNRAVEHEAESIIRAVIGHPYFDRSLEDWLYLYYGAVMKNLWRSAGAIKDQVDFNDQVERDNLFMEYDGGGLDQVPADIDATDLEKIIVAIENLPSESPEPSSDWRLYVTNFPLKRGRPDLVQIFTYKLGLDLQYTEWDVLNRMERRFCFVDLFVDKRIHRNQLPLITLLGETNTPFVIDPQMVDSLLNPNTRASYLESWRLLVECVLTTGKRLVLDQTMNSDVVDLERVEETVDKVNHESHQSLNLKKLCRLSIRQNMITKIISGATVKRCDWLTLYDAILSLNIKYLPKCLVNYLLYREENVKRPLYYRLLDLDIINTQLIHR